MPSAILVAHGSPADPVPQEAALKALAVRVAMWLPAGWCVRGATLAAPGALEAAIARHPDALIAPFFMAEGWFTRTNLPKRLAALGAGHLRRLPAFGTDAGIPELIRQTALDACQTAGLRPDETTLLIAAHGSQVSPASANRTKEIVAQITDQGPFKAVTCGFVEEAPYLADAAQNLGAALCLPFFATSAGHVMDDVPEALDKAGFKGPLLAPLGEAPDAARVIALALLAAS